MKKVISIGSNLKHYRKKNNLTQKQLAEIIDYTEKSVSKWESDNGLPTLEMLLKLAELFKVTLDELVYGRAACNYFLGIDGGGTKTVFKLVDEYGIEINRICKGSCNPNDIGMKNTMSVLGEGINEVCRGIPYSGITMYAGLSGGGLTGDNDKILKQFFDKFGFKYFENGSDIENLVALSDCQKCILIIMGTGFIVYVINGTERKRISGWGQFFDDGGSGYTLGRDAIIAALGAIDGSGEPTILTELLEKRIGESVQAHLAKFYQGGKRYIAEFSDLVFEGLKMNDLVCYCILEKNMKFVANKISAALAEIQKSTPEEIVPILFSGGISSQKEVLFPLIEKHIVGEGYDLIRLEDEPIDGALRYAKMLFEQKQTIIE